MTLFLISLYLDRFPDTFPRLYRRFLRLIELTRPFDSQGRFLRLGSIFVGMHSRIPYSRKIWRGIKFGGLAVYYYNRQIKIRQNFLLIYIRMAIPYRTAKFKSANILSIAILGSTAKFNARQYFRLYGNCEELFAPFCPRFIHII